MKRFVLDVESASTCDLKTAGAAKYWEDPETRVICVSYMTSRTPGVFTWRPGDGTPYFTRDIHANGWRVVAHNWLFEYNCWTKVLGPKYGWPYPAIEAWDCTMARALYWGLPAGLIHVAEALHIPHQIDTGKKARIKRMARPRTLSPLTWWHETDPEKLKELIEDCEQDVRAEAALDDVLPLLPPTERKIFLLDGRINQRGIRVDLPMIEKLGVLTASEGARLNEDMAGLTDGRVRTTNQVAAITAELERLGYSVPSLAKADVAAAIKALDGDKTGNAWTARGVLRCRQEAAKASTAKLAAMRNGASRDGRCRGLFQYGGAGRTLRWAGRRVQPQNYPRGTVKGVASIFAMLERANMTADELGVFLPGSVMDAVSSMLRGCFIASPGYVFVSGDLSQIEARVVAWLAGQASALAVFARGEDIYTYTAKGIGSDNRQLGKVLVLACGFSMGPDKFRDTAATYGITLTAEEAEAAVQGWRALNEKIVSFWWEVDRAAKAVAMAPHGELRVGRFIVIRKTKKAMRIVLPSGRELTYQNVEVETDENGRENLSYMGVDPKTKRWTRIRTYGGRLVENITQAVARDVMAEAMLVLDARGESIVGTVHDELLGETGEPDAAAALHHMLTVMRTPPKWAPGLPVNAEGWTGRRYRK